MAWWTNLAAATAVFSREGVRNARRWQTYGLRVLFSTLLIGMALMILADRVSYRMDPFAASQLGRTMFVGYAGFQMFLAALFAPMLVGLGITEEQDDRTIELLAITPLTPRQILWGKVTSRLLVLATVVLGATPVLALTVSFGGVSVWEVVNATVNTLVVVVVLGVLGGVVALSVRGPVVPLVSGMAYAIPAMLLVPVGFVFSVRGRQEDFALLSPPVAMFQDSPVGLLPALAFLPVVLLVLRWGGPLFALATVEDSDEGSGGRLSTEFWELERHRRRLGWLGLLLGLGTPVCAFGAYSLVPLTSHGVSMAVEAVAWVWSVMVLVGGTGLYLLVVARAAETVRHFQRLRDVVSGARFSDMPLAAARQLNPLRRWVWPNPVAWREVVTHGLGPTGFLARWGWLVWLATCSLAMLADDDAGAAWTVGTGTLVAVMFTLAQATASMARERAGRTFPLLLSTTMSSVGVVAGKLVGVALASWPYLAMGWVVWGLFLGIERYDSVYWYGMTPQDRCGHWTIGRGIPMLQATATAVWLFAVWASYAVGCMITATRVRPARLAWATNVAMAVGFVLVPFILDEVVRGPFSDDVAYLWIPIGQWGFGYPACGVSPAMVVSTAGWSLVAVGLFVLLCMRLRAWAASGRG